MCCSAAAPRKAGSRNHQAMPFAATTRPVVICAHTYRYGISMSPLLKLPSSSLSQAVLTLNTADTTGMEFPRGIANKVRSQTVGASVMFSRKGVLPRAFI